MPSSLQLRMTRSAISPRLAINILLNNQFLFSYEMVTCEDDAFVMLRGFDQEKRLVVFDGFPFSTSISVTLPATSDSISFISFIASIIQRTVPC